jgi:hypothetical protein
MGVASLSQQGWAHTPALPTPAPPQSPPPAGPGPSPNPPPPSRARPPPSLAAWSGGRAPPPLAAASLATSPRRFPARRSWPPTPCRRRRTPTPRSRRCRACPASTPSGSCISRRRSRRRAAPPGTTRCSASTTTQARRGAGYCSSYSAAPTRAPSGCMVGRDGGWGGAGARGGSSRAATGEGRPGFRPGRRLHYANGRPFSSPCSLPTSRLTPPISVAARRGA